MRCFYYFKERTKTKPPRSAPELNDQNKSDLSGAERMIKSSGLNTSPRSMLELYEERAQNLRDFSFVELREATNGFSKLLKIGEGGFGSVYKGSIKAVDGNGDHIIVAIKMLNRDGLQGHKQWFAEVQFLGVVEHPNLVKLIGYCAVEGERGMQRLLVYEFMPNKSLEDHLFNGTFPVLTWKTRLQIALGAAEGLTYLHEQLEVQVIFRDFKCSNVLLDKDFNPKLSDFGLARQGPTDGKSHVSTTVMGTFGYAAPDYVETGHLTAKSDVYSFGVVLYELLTGRRSFDRGQPKTEQRLLDWVKRYPVNSKKFSLIIDLRLENEYSLQEAQAIAKLADICLLKSAKDRPMMSQVVERLKEIIKGLEDEDSSQKSNEETESDTVDSDKRASDMRPLESARRRVAHLAKLSEQVGGFSPKKFMVMQRANVT